MKTPEQEAESLVSEMSFMQLWRLMFPLYYQAILKAPRQEKRKPGLDRAVAGPELSTFVPTINPRSGAIPLAPPGYLAFPGVFFFSPHPP